LGIITAETEAMKPDREPRSPVTTHLQQNQEWGCRQSPGQGAAVEVQLLGHAGHLVHVADGVVVLGDRLGVLRDLLLAVHNVPVLVLRAFLNDPRGGGLQPPGWKKDAG